MLSHTESFFLINTHYYTLQNLIVHSSQPLYRKTPGKFIITAINIISELIRESYDPHRQRETSQRSGYSAGSQCHVVRSRGGFDNTVMGPVHGPSRAVPHRGDTGGLLLGTGDISVRH